MDIRQVGVRHLEELSPCGQNGGTWTEQPPLNNGFVASVKTAGQCGWYAVELSTLF